MAVPPRFPGMIPAYGVQIPQMTPMMPFPNPYFMPNPIMAAAAAQRMAAPPAPQPKPPEKPPVTTVFVGNINEKCGNELIRAILTECGAVATWKRIQGSNGKFQAFGFCEFESPFGTMRALRILHDYPLAEKKLVVKKTRREKFTPETLASDEMPADEDNIVDDEEIRQKIQTLIEKDAPDLVPIEDGELAEKTRSPALEKGKDRTRDRSIEKRKERKDNDKYNSRHRAHSHSRSDSRGRHKSRKRSRSDSERSDVKKSCYRSSSRSGESSRSSSSSSSNSSFSNRSGSHTRKAFRSQSPSRDRDSEDSDEQKERRALRKQIREKEIAYADRLRKWEARERRQAKLYERDEQREKQRKRDMQKEAKKLKHFLEDYDDERMDQKYYKSSSLFQRRRDFEREREADAKDRQHEEARKRHEEQEEALLRKLRADSGSPNPHRPLGQKPLPSEPEKDDESEESESDSESEGSVEEAIKMEKPEKRSSWKAVTSEDILVSNSPVVSVASPSIISSSLASPAVVRTDVITPARPSTSSHLNGIFGFEENDEDAAFQKKKLKPFEITEEDRIQAMTSEERKQMIKDLIDRIPTAKNDLFAFPINWNYVDKSLVEQRVKPWVSKKITDYIGEEEASLVDFVLDDEAEVFVVKMWRLLIYESEAKNWVCQENRKKYLLSESEEELLPGKMQFESSPRSIPKFLIQNARGQICRGPKMNEELNLQMYLEPPKEDITLFEFRELALNRLRVLKIVEQVKDRFPCGTEAINDELTKLLLKLMPIACGCCPFEEMEIERKRDTISHFILRLAFCQTPEQAKWFIQQEVSKSCDAVTQFLHANNFDAQLVTDDEKRNLKEDLSNACSIQFNKVASTNFWKVPFEDALDLIRKRRVLLISGDAFVSEDDLQVILCTRLRLNMAATMAQLSSRSYVGKNYIGTDASGVTPDMVDSFDKQYAYNIRHNYGKEGKHADYSAYPCTKIILDLSPSTSDCHGCPYRHSNLQLLAHNLESSGLSKSQSEHIILLSKNAQYDKACTRYFEFNHKMAENSLGTVITHPNQYFELSRQVREGRRNREKEPKYEIKLTNMSHVNTAQRGSDVDIEDLIKMETSKVN
ncbi:DNA primase large subunit [Dirofilaria immitis]|nr:DNA primase large subunit [Dirofilaria immitis]